jgi:hypothetical protein
MRVMVFVKATEDSEKGLFPTAEMSAKPAAALVKKKAGGLASSGLRHALQRTSVRSGSARRASSCARDR